MRCYPLVWNAIKAPREEIDSVRMKDSLWYHWAPQGLPEAVNRGIDSPVFAPLLPYLVDECLLELADVLGHSVREPSEEWLKSMNGILLPEMSLISNQLDNIYKLYKVLVDRYATFSRSFRLSDTFEQRSLAAEDFVFEFCVPIEQALAECQNSVL